MGGWSAEREVSLRSGKACAEALESAGYGSRASMPAATSPSELRASCARRLLQRAARPLGRGRLRAGPARAAGHPLHAFGRAGLGARHAQGARQGRDARGRRAGGRRQGRDAGARRPRRTCWRGPMSLKPVAEGSSVGVVHRPRGPRAPAAGAQRSGLGVRRGPAGRALHPRPRADLRRHRRPRRRRHRDRAGRGAALLQLRGQVRAGRLAARAAGPAFTECLRIGAEVNLDGP